MRHPHTDLASVLAHPTPQIDLRLQAYEISTSNFLKAVTNYTHRAMAEITKHRTAQETDKRKIAERTQAVETEMNQCKVKEIELLAGESRVPLPYRYQHPLVLEKEQEERREAEQSVTALKRQLASLREASAAIHSEIEHYRAIVSSLQRGAALSTLYGTYHNSTNLDKDVERDILNRHASQLESEVAACESWLKCKIEGIEADHLLIRFSHIDEANLDREFSFVLDVSTPSYNGEPSHFLHRISLISDDLVITTTPPLPALPILLQELNQSGDVYRFIKRVRSAFRDLVQIQP